MSITTIEKLTEWANDNPDGRIEPDAVKRGDGWSPGEKPPAQWENFLQNEKDAKINEIIDALDDLGTDGSPIGPIDNFVSPSGEIGFSIGAIGPEIYEPESLAQTLAYTAMQSEAQATYARNAMVRENDQRAIMAGNFSGIGIVPCEDRLVSNLNIPTGITGVFIDYSTATVKQTQGEKVIAVATRTPGRAFTTHSVRGSRSNTSYSYSVIGGVPDSTSRETICIGSDGASLYVMAWLESDGSVKLQKYSWSISGATWVPDAAWPSLGLSLPVMGSGQNRRHPKILFRDSKLFCFCPWNYQAGAYDETVAAIVAVDPDNGTILDQGAIGSADMPDADPFAIFEDVAILPNGTIAMLVTEPSTWRRMIIGDSSDLTAAFTTNTLVIGADYFVRGMYAIGQNNLCIILDEGDAVRVACYRLDHEAADVSTLTHVYSLAKADIEQPTWLDELPPI